MNTNFDNLKEKVKIAASATVDATKQFAIISKCKMQIAAEQEKIRSLYAKLGKLYYKDFITDEEPDEAEYNPLCKQISNHYRKISALRDRIEEVRDNYQGVKEENIAAKKKAEAAETHLMRLATLQTCEEPPVQEAAEDVSAALEEEFEIAAIAPVEEFEDTFKAQEEEFDEFPIADEEADLLEELNSLNDSTYYGELLD